MEAQLEVQPPEVPATTEIEAMSDDLLGSAGYFVRTELRAGASCPTSYFRWGNECKERSGMEC